MRDGITDEDARMWGREAHDMGLTLERACPATAMGDLAMTRASLASVIVADLERRLALRRFQLEALAQNHLDGRRAAVLGK